MALAEVGEIDLLVNNVGGGDGSAVNGFLDFEDKLWQDVFELNFFAAVRVARAALPSLVRRQGSIVTISSNGARIPHSGPIAYTTAKWPRWSCTSPRRRPAASLVPTT